MGATKKKRRRKMDPTPFMPVIGVGLVAWFALTLLIRHPGIAGVIAGIITFALAGNM